MLLAAGVGLLGLNPIFFAHVLYEGSPRIAAFDRWLSLHHAEILWFASSLVTSLLAYLVCRVEIWADSGSVYIKKSFFLKSICAPLNELASVLLINRLLIYRTQMEGQLFRRGPRERLEFWGISLLNKDNTEIAIGDKLYAREEARQLAERIAKALGLNVSEIARSSRR
jgi:hypothetical protein